MRRAQRLAGRLLTGAARAWPVVLTSFAGGLAVLGVLAAVLPDGRHRDWVYAAFRLLCHQRPDRCYFIGGRQVALCERCVALYLSSWVGGILFMALRRRLPKIPGWLLAAGWMPLALDGTLQLAGFHESGPWARTLTGALAGGISSVFVLQRISRGMDQVVAVVTDVFRGPDDPRDSRA